MDIRVKFCGLTRTEDVRAAADAGAAYMGLVFFARSPRHVSHAQARTLAEAAPPGLAKVALTVNASDSDLDALLEAVPLDMIQLHGSEPVERVTAVKARYGLPVMKAVGVASAEDLRRVDAFADVADQVLVDAKPPKGGALPGGNGLAFDWELLADWAPRGRWMLAGGLTPENAAEATRRTGATQLDLSSGVEDMPGVKSAQKMRSFMDAVTRR